MASISSSNNTSLFPSWPSESNSTTTSMRDASFSSYLNSSEETYIRALAESSRSLNLSHTVISDHERDPTSYDSTTKKAEDQEEIDVFSADKYFNGDPVDHQGSKQIVGLSAKKYEHQYQQQQHRSPRLKAHQVQPRTPSSQSESSSSWHSQSALLRRVGRIPSSRSTSSNNNNNKTQGRPRRRLLSCSCCGKSSTDVKDELVHNHGIRTSLEASDITRMNRLRLDRHHCVIDGTIDDPFVFPPVSDSSNLTPKENNENKDPRKSIEVFGSNEFIVDDERLGSKRFSLEKRLNMLAWDAIVPPNMEEEEDEELISNNSSRPPSETTYNYYKDTESDASSDLFELDCLSCAAANPVAVGVGGGGGCATPLTTTTATTCYAYAPSEASIEWSVVTASAAPDFASDSEDAPRAAAAPHGSATPFSASRRKMASPKPPLSGILLPGCRSQKAVRVAEEISRTPGGRRVETPTPEIKIKRYSDSFVPVKRVQVDNEAKLVAARLGQRQRQADYSVVALPRTPRWSHS